MAHCYRPTGNSVCGKICMMIEIVGTKEQKYPENAMKNKLSVGGANSSQPSLKKTFEKCRQTKNIN